MSVTDAPVWLSHVAGLVMPVIMRHEGLRLSMYRDTAGCRTVGYGCNLEALGAKKACYQVGVSYVGLLIGQDKLTEAQARDILTLQVFGAIEDAIAMFPEFLSFPDKVKIVVVDLMFNLGHPKLSGFVHFIAAVNAREWKTAASCLRNSLWAGQVGDRAKDDVGMLEAA